MIHLESSNKTVIFVRHTLRYQEKEMKIIISFIIITLWPQVCNFLEKSSTAYYVNFV